MAAPPVDYYASLEIDPKATQPQIREAYKKAALKHHPDRVPSDSTEREARTKRFQQINDAYYTLSDPTRRRDYDAARSYHGFPSDSTGTGSSSKTGSFPWSSFGFPFGGGASSSSSAAADDEAEHDRFSKEQFGGVFEEMLREEGMAEGDNARPTGKFWSIVGGLSGGAMGFIVANFPGAVAGAVAGNRLGAVRDTKGKSVYAVFQELPQAEKARLLSDLAAKVFASAVAS